MIGKYYTSLLKAIKNRFLFYNFKLKKDNKYFMIFDLGMEDLVIPKFQFNDFIVFYFVRNGRVVYKYKNSSAYKIPVFNKFLKEVWQRQLDNLNRYDSI